MNLFIETSQMRARRARDGGAPTSAATGSPLFPGASGLHGPDACGARRERGDGAPAASAARTASAANRERTGGIFLPRGSGFARPAREGAAARRDAPMRPDAAAQEDARPHPDGSYSIQQEAYQAEIAFDRRRSRRRRLLAVARIIALIILIPLGLVLLFLIAYALTCIMDGASPEELLMMLGALWQRVLAFV